MSPSKPYGKFYVNSNHVEGFESISQNNWAGGVQCDNLEETKLNSEIDIDNNVKTTTASQALGADQPTGGQNCGNLGPGSGPEAS